MRWKKRRPNKIRFARFLLAFISRRFAKWPMSIKVHWKHVLNGERLSQKLNGSFWIKKVSNVFYQFPFPIQYFANFWIIHNALRSVSCSIYLYLSRQKSSEKNYSLYNQTAWLVTLSKEEIKLKNIFSSDKIRFYHTVFLFFFFTLYELINWIFMDLRLKKVRSPGWRGRGGTISYLAKAGMCLLVIVFRVHVSRKSRNFSGSKSNQVEI